MYTGDDDKNKYKWRGKEAEKKALLKAFPQAKHLDTKVIDKLTEVGEYINVSPAQIFALIKHESGWNATIESGVSTAKGLFQFTKGTRDYIGLEDDAFKDNSNESVIKQLEGFKRYVKPMRTSIRKAANPAVAMNMMNYLPAYVKHIGKPDKEFPEAAYKVNPALGKTVGDYIERFNSIEPFSSASKTDKLEAKRLLGEESSVTIPNATSQQKKIKVPEETTEENPKFNSGTSSIAIPPDYDPTGDYISGGASAIMGAGSIASGNIVGGSTQVLGGLANLATSYMRDKKNESVREAQLAKKEQIDYANNLRLDPNRQMIQASEGLNVGKEDVVEAEKDELVIRKVGNNYRIVADFTGGKKHEEGGEKVVVKQNDIIVPADKKSNVKKMFNKKTLKKNRKAQFLDAINALPKSAPTMNKYGNGKSYKKYQNGLYSDDISSNSQLPYFFQNPGLMQGLNKDTGIQGSVGGFDLSGRNLMSTSQNNPLPNSPQKFNFPSVLGSEGTGKERILPEDFRSSKKAPDYLSSQGPKENNLQSPTMLNPSSFSEDISASPTTPISTTEQDSFLSQLGGLINPMYNMAQSFSDAQKTPRYNISPQKIEVDREVYRRQFDNITERSAVVKSMLSNQAGSAGQKNARLRAVQTQQARQADKVRQAFSSDVLKTQNVNRQAKTQTDMFNVQADTRADQFDAQAEAKRRLYMNTAMQEMQERRDSMRKERYMKKREEKAREMDQYRLKLLDDRYTQFGINQDGSTYYKGASPGVDPALMMGSKNTKSK